MFALLGIRGIVYLIIAGIVAASLGGMWYTLRAKYIQIGYNKAIHQIATQNQEAIKLSAQVKDAVKKCFDDGGEWSVEDATCVKP